jgi:hypothetical protein
MLRSVLFLQSVSSSNRSSRSLVRLHRAGGSPPERRLLPRRQRDRVGLRSDVFGMLFMLDGERWMQTLSAVLATPSNRVALAVSAAAFR